MYLQQQLRCRGAEDRAAAGPPGVAQPLGVVGVHVRQEVGCHGHPVVTPEVHGDVHALAQGQNDALRHGVLCALCAAPQAQNVLLSSGADRRHFQGRGRVGALTAVTLHTQAVVSWRCSPCLQI